MKLYLVQFDGDHNYVEAATYKDAVAAWLAYGKTHWDLDGTEEPDGVSMVSDDPVIR